MLSVAEFSAQNYRSLCRIRFPVDRLAVFIGPNGVGKTNLYRGLQLLQSAAANRLAYDLAAEGGMGSAFWAGERQHRTSARIGLEVGLGDADSGLRFVYQVQVGLVPQVNTGGFQPVRTILGAGFADEPQIKFESLKQERRRRSTKLLQRDGPSGFAIDDEGKKRAFDIELLPNETAIGGLVDGARFPDFDLVRRSMLAWRFYHDFRTDADAALRRPCLAVTTPMLSSDGADLAAVFATLVHIREDTVDLDRTIDDAFPGARLVVPEPGRFASFGMVFPDYPKRVFEASELSDGTLRFLALAGALLAYRLPPFLALNEPEASLHPDMLEPLARLIVKASQRAQIWLVTHSERLAQALTKHGGVRPRRVVKRDGATWIEGLKLVGNFGDEDEDEA